jgi:hypothetical protein
VVLVVVETRPGSAEYPGVLGPLTGPVTVPVPIFEEVEDFAEDFIGVAVPDPVPGAADGLVPELRGTEPDSDDLLVPDTGVAGAEDGGRTVEVCGVEVGTVGATGVEGTEVEGVACPYPPPSIPSNTNGNRKRTMTIFNGRF